MERNYQAVIFLIAELSEVSKTRHLAVKILSADFAVARKNSRRNLCCLLKKYITSVTDVSETNTPTDDIRLFFVLVMKFMMICHY